MGNSNSTGNLKPLCTDGNRKILLPQSMGLKQLGRSIKYMTLAEKREEQKKKAKEAAKIKRANTIAAKNNATNSLSHESTGRTSLSREDSKSQYLQSSGYLNGEWELEHDFMCSSCGEIFDELREVWHHKWDAHPGCLVMHITLPRKYKTYLPPHNLIYPQLGRQLITGEGAANGLQFKGKGKKKRKGGKQQNISDVNKTEIPPQIKPQNFYTCKKCYK